MSSKFPDGFLGGIWLLWKRSNFEVKVITSHKRFIYCQIRDNIKENLWLATFRAAKKARNSGSARDSARGRGRSGSFAAQNEPSPSRAQAGG